MLSVPTYLAPSRISGVGLFSAKAIPVGTRIWEFTEGVDWQIAPEELDRFPEPYRSRMRHYVYLNGSGLYVLCGDNARFMNHEPDPNCSDADSRFTVTIKDVEPGDELTCDYREFDEESPDDGPLFGAS